MGEGFDSVVGWACLIEHPPHYHNDHKIASSPSSSGSLPPEPRLIEHDQGREVLRLQKQAAL